MDTLRMACVNPFVLGGQPLTPGCFSPFTAGQQVAVHREGYWVTRQLWWVIYNRTIKASVQNKPHLSTVVINKARRGLPSHV